MNKEELQKMKCCELFKLATSIGIKGAWKMKKAYVIEAILGAEKNAEVVESAKENIKIDNPDVEVENKTQKESANIDVDLEGKMQRIEAIEIGTLVAFKLSNGKVKSAKVVRKSSKNRKLKVETEYGAQYITPYEDVIWVRSGKRWPRGVYMMLKGLVDDGEQVSES